MTRMIDADALIDRIEADKKQDNISPGNFFLFKAYIMNALTIEPDGDTISRSQAIKGVSEWATDILHPDKLIKEDAIHILESLPSAEQVTGKLNNPDDFLLTADSEACKEQKSKLDLISRQDAILAITGEPPEAHYPSWYADRIKSLPSAPDSRQRGEWVHDANGYDYGLPAWKCDKCGCINANIPPKIMTKDGKPNYAPVNPNSFSGSNFCPNCGADMRGEEE